MSRLPFLTTTCFCLLFFLTPTIIATPAPVPAPVNGDPCGPAIQDTPNYPNTCAIAPALVESPQPYGINCTAIAPINSKVGVAWQNCSISYEDACTKALDPRTRKGFWVWTELASNCALGFFLPPYQGSAQLLNFTRCVEIFTAMNDTCSTVVPASDFAGVNLITIPGHPPSSKDGKTYDGYPTSNLYFYGNAVNVGYPSYAISYTPSTY